MSKKSDSHAESPGVKIPPPLIVLISILAGIALNPLWRDYGPAAPYLQMLGFFMLGVAATLATYSMLSFRHHQTNILPHKPDQNLMVSGPFLYSRNPIYLAMIICQISISFIINMPMVFVTGIATYGALRYYVIAKEERYLEHTFGDPYREFKNRVRRWF